MTAQLKEILYYNAKRFFMATEPLNQYFKYKSIPQDFVMQNTACWRGYRGTWKIKKQKMYLTELKAYVKGNKQVDIEYVFPEQQEVFAEWFNGVIRIPHGKMFKHVHLGYESIFEKELLLKFNNGILIEEKTIKNQQLT